MEQILLDRILSINLAMSTVMFCWADMSQPTAEIAVLPRSVAETDLPQA